MGRSLSWWCVALFGVASVACRCAGAPGGELRFGTLPSEEGEFLTLSASITTRDDTVLLRIPAAAGELRIELDGGAKALTEHGGTGHGRIVVSDAGAGRAFGESLLLALGSTARLVSPPHRPRTHAPIAIAWNAADFNGHAVFTLDAVDTTSQPRWSDLALYVNERAGEIGFDRGASPRAYARRDLWAFASHLSGGRLERIGSGDPSLAASTPLLALPATTVDAAVCPDSESIAWSANDLVCATQEGLAHVAGPSFDLAKPKQFMPFPKRQGLRHTYALRMSPTARRVVLDASFDGDPTRRLTLFDLSTGRQTWSQPVAMDSVLQPLWSSDGTRILVRTAPELETRLELLDARTGVTTARLAVPDSIQPLGSFDETFLLTDDRTNPVHAELETPLTPVEEEEPWVVRAEQVVSAFPNGTPRAYLVKQWREGGAALEPVEHNVRRSGLPGACSLEYDAKERVLRLNDRPLTPLRRDWYETLMEQYSRSTTSSFAGHTRLDWLGPCHVVLQDAPRSDPVVVNLETGRWQYLLPEGGLSIHAIRDDAKQLIVGDGDRIGVVDVPGSLP